MKKRLFTASAPHAPGLSMQESSAFAKRAESKMSKRAALTANFTPPPLKYKLQREAEIWPSWRILHSFCFVSQVYGLLRTSWQYCTLFFVLAQGGKGCKIETAVFATLIRRRVRLGRAGVPAHKEREAEAPWIGALIRAPPDAKTPPISTAPSAAQGRSRAHRTDGISVSSTARGGRPSRPRASQEPLSCSWSSLARTCTPRP